MTPHHSVKSHTLLLYYICQVNECSGDLPSYLWLFSNYATIFFLKPSFATMANAHHLNKRTTVEKALKAYNKDKKSAMSRTVDAIARTPEYFRFMSDLTAFHKQHG